MRSQKSQVFTTHLCICSFIILAFTGCSKSDIKPDKNPALANLPGYTYTLAGNSHQGFDNGLRVNATFNNPSGIATDAAGNLYITDQVNNAIRKITPAGLVTTFAGSGSAGAEDGVQNQASFNNPIGIAVDGSNNVFVADFGNNLVRKITPDGTVSTWAGTGAIGFDDGPANSATFNGPVGIAIDHSGNVYVSDNHNAIRKISPGRIVTTFAGNVHAQLGSADGTGPDANFYFPSGLAVDASNNLYVADYGNNIIRKITPEAVVTTISGYIDKASANGVPLNATFNKPMAVAVDASGNLYVSDNGNDVIKKIAVSGEVTTIAGTGGDGGSDGKNEEATFRDIHGIALDASGNIFVADGYMRIRKIIPNK